MSLILFPLKRWEFHICSIVQNLIWFCGERGIGNLHHSHAMYHVWMATDPIINCPPPILLWASSLWQMNIVGPTIHFTDLYGSICIIGFRNKIVTVHLKCKCEIFVPEAYVAKRTIKIFEQDHRKFPNVTAHYGGFQNMQYENLWK